MQYQWVTKYTIQYKAIPYNTVGALSDSNSPSALSARAGSEIQIIELGDQLEMLVHQKMRQLLYQAAIWR